jgi:hypothetical protein
LFTAELALRRFDDSPPKTTIEVEEMYRRPKFLEVLLEIRQDMARLADYDVDLFAEMVRSGKGIREGATYSLIELENGTRGDSKAAPAKNGSRNTVRKA